MLTGRLTSPPALCYGKKGFEPHRHDDWPWAPFGAPFSFARTGEGKGRDPRPNGANRKAADVLARRPREKR
jgi:hypothetical protein